ITAVFNARCCIVCAVCGASPDRCDARRSWWASAARGTRWCQCTQALRRTVGRGNEKYVRSVPLPVQQCCASFLTQLPIYPAVAQEYKRTLRHRPPPAPWQPPTAENRPDATSAPDRDNARHGSGQWAWGPGAGGTGGGGGGGGGGEGDYGGEGTLAARRHIAALLEEEGANSAGAAEAGTTSFRLRDRWENRLAQDDKDYIEALRAQGEAAREREGVRKGAKQGRLELLRRKAEERKVGGASRGEA
ncbi:hypothetical protein JKP88DRAFT_267118, partial [Tribonema minus]